MMQEFITIASTSITRQKETMAVLNMLTQATHRNSIFASNLFALASTVYAKLQHPTPIPKDGSCPSGLKQPRQLLFSGR